ncbi:hypothetical protein ASF04_16225 [Duganella sp. Leaf61]|nr:hypothetical protein ASF04_16225 [Duganella sp. Leaf61]
MSRQHALFELGSVKRLRFAAFFTCNERFADCIQLGTAFLLPPYQIPDVLTVIGEISRVDLGLDPQILLIR